MNGDVEQYGGVGRDEPRITSASRYTQQDLPDEIEEDPKLTAFLKEIQNFKQYFWNEFIASKKSQSPEIVDEYIQLLNYMYICLVKNTQCKQLPYKSFNSSNISLSSLMNTVDRVQSTYWLKRSLIQFPFTYNMNKFLDNN